MSNALAMLRAVALVALVLFLFRLVYHLTRKDFRTMLEGIKVQIAAILSIEPQLQAQIAQLTAERDAAVAKAAQFDAAQADAAAIEADATKAAQGLQALVTPAAPAA